MVFASSDAQTLREALERAEAVREEALTKVVELQVALAKCEGVVAEWVAALEAELEGVRVGDEIFRSTTH